MNMHKTIKALRAAGLDCKIVVGGAALTAEYAKEIEADFLLQRGYGYSKGCQQSI